MDKAKSTGTQLRVGLAVHIFPYAAAFFICQSFFTAFAVKNANGLLRIQAFKNGLGKGFFSKIVEDAAIDLGFTYIVDSLIGKGEDLRVIFHRGIAGDAACGSRFTKAMGSGPAAIGDQLRAVNVGAGQAAVIHYADGNSVSAFGKGNFHIFREAGTIQQHIAAAVKMKGKAAIFGSIKGFRKFRHGIGGGHTPEGRIVGAVLLPAGMQLQVMINLIVTIIPDPLSHDQISFEK